MPSSLTYLSKRLKTLKTSSTLALSQKAHTLRQKGVDVVNLSVGELSFSPPAHVLKALHGDVARADARYTAVSGTQAVRQSVATFLKKHHHIDYDLDEVMVSSGAKQVLYNAFLATLNPGEEVLMAAPYWVSYPEMIQLCGGVPRTLPTDHTFTMAPEVLEKAITPKTKWVLFNSPQNPTGHVISKDLWRAYGDVLRSYPHVLVMCDDIYEALYYGDDGPRAPSFLKVCPDFKDRTLVVSGLSKAYAMTGWRLGYGAGPKNLMKAMGLLQSHTTSHPCALAQTAAVAALEGDHDFLEIWRLELKARRDILVEGVNQVPGLACTAPMGAFYVFVSCQDWMGCHNPAGGTFDTDHDICQAILDHAHVAVVPGSAFGAPGFFRASFAGTSESLVKASERLKIFSEKTYTPRARL